ncbi:hypothetical protein MUK42_36154 [Musa troglodytarum]|uniref:Uncharacterized protein n=1 Tax=Musa troglodytarum TaxID=320322 RepID=A0A9E7EDC9_9LILI|nr:hypothetical protein MUK42_36154 [Musa troglodytarum]
MKNQELSKTFFLYAYAIHGCDGSLGFSPIPDSIATVHSPRLFLADCSRQPLEFDGLNMLVDEAHTGERRKRDTWTVVDGEAIPSVMLEYLQNVDDEQNSLVFFLLSPFFGANLKALISSQTED